MDLCYYKLPPLKLISIVLGVFWKKLWKEVLFNSEVIDSTWPQLRIFCLRILYKFVVPFAAVPWFYKWSVFLTTALLQTSIST